MRLGLPKAKYNINNHNQAYKILKNIAFTCNVTHVYVVFLLVSLNFTLVFHITNVYIGFLVSLTFALVFGITKGPWSNARAAFIFINQIIVVVILASRTLVKLVSTH